jgi:hypothetical protein
MILLGASLQPVESLKVVRLEWWNAGMIEGKTHISKNTLYFHPVVEIPRR